MKLWAAASSAFLWLASVSPRAAAAELELAAECLATLSVDDATRAGGAGMAVEIGTVVLDRALNTPGAIVLQGKVGALGGAGMAWLGEVTAAYRLKVDAQWQPSAGLSLLWVGGDMVRSIDSEGNLAEDPWALRLGVEPLHFELHGGWISALGIRAGPTLFRSGSPPLSLSLMLFQVGIRL